MWTDPDNIPGYITREDRATVDLPAILTPFAGSQIEARIRNISTGGFFAESARPIAIGSQILVFCPRFGRLPAQVRWALGTRLGAVFNGAPDAEVKAAIAACIPDGIARKQAELPTLR